MSTRMVCPYDPQQCDYPRCLNKENPNYYDERCAKREIESTLKAAENIASEDQMIKSNKGVSEAGVLLSEFIEIAKRIKEQKEFKDGFLVIQHDDIVYWQHRDGRIETL